MQIAGRCLYSWHAYAQEELLGPSSLAPVEASKHQYHRRGGQFFISMLYEKNMKIEISRYYHANLAKPISQSQETRTRWFKTPGLLYHAGRCTMYIVYNLHLHMKHLLEIYIYCTFWTDETDVAERAKLVGPTRWRDLM